MTDMANINNANNEDNIMIVGNLNIYDIYFKKYRNNRKIYVFKNGINNTIKIRTPYLKIPFGVENYFGKSILNVEFTNYKNNNHSLTFFTTIKQIDDLFNKFIYDKNNINKFKNLSETIFHNLDDYNPSINMRDKYDPLMRIHLKKTKNKITTRFYKIVNGEKTIASPYSCKGKSCRLELELSSMWIRDNKYGLIWYANEVLIY